MILNNLKIFDCCQINSKGKLLIKSIKNHPFKYFIAINLREVILHRYFYRYNSEKN